MTTFEIKNKIQETRKALEALEKQLGTEPCLKDNFVKKKIADAAARYNQVLQECGFKGIGDAFGQISNNGKLADRSIFLTFKADTRSWKWEVRINNGSDEVLVRVDKETNEVID
jgi:hypothetical protein